MDLGLLFAFGLTAVVSVTTFVVGLLRWTGHSRAWANPYRVNVSEIALIGRSPLSWIAGSILLMSILVAALVLDRSLVAAYAIAFAITVPSLIIYVVIRLLRPSWSDPPWLATQEWKPDPLPPKRRDPDDVE